MECVHDIQEFHVKDIEQGVVNVGQSWHVSGAGTSTEGAKSGNQLRRGREGMRTDGIERSPREGFDSKDHLPQDLSELVLQVQWLQHRVEELEARLSHAEGRERSTGAGTPSKVEFKIQKLYVRELTGTLNIGVTSFQDGPVEWAVPTVDPADETEADWRKLEREGDEDWITDNPPSDAVD